MTMTAGARGFSNRPLRPVGITSSRPGPLEESRFRHDDPQRARFHGCGHGSGAEGVRDPRLEHRRVPTVPPRVLGSRPPRRRRVRTRHVLHEDGDARPMADRGVGPRRDGGRVVARLRCRRCRQGAAPRADRLRLDIDEGNTLRAVIYGKDERLAALLAAYRGFDA